MNRLFSRGALLALFALSLNALSAAFDPAVVGADARWVVHADLNALRASTLGKELVTAVEKAQTEATGGFVGIDISKLLATVGHLTAYGSNLTPKAEAIDGTLLVQGTADLRKIAESLLLQGTLAQPKVFSEVSDLPFPAYALSDPKAKADDKTQVIVAFPPEPIVLVSKSRAQLLKAREVFRGQAASLAQTPSSPLASLTQKSHGSYLFMASVVPTEPLFPQNAPQARILQLATSGALAIGEQGGNTFAHAELLASSGNNAEKLMKILQGMTAMLSLAESNDKQLAEFLNSTTVAREKDTVTLDLAYSSARLAQMIQAMRASGEVRPANRAPTITAGTAVAEWGGDDAKLAPDAAKTPVVREIQNVKLGTGDMITLGRSLNGGRDAKFLRVEAVPTGGGAPLTFTSEFMRSVRGSMWQFPFPAADGSYTLKVSYLPDPEGKAKFAVSVREPKAAPNSPPAPGR